MKNKHFVESLNAAVEGFIYVLKTQRNMRIHFLFAVFILILGLYINLSKPDLLFIFLAACLVLICEMINTCVELTIDLIKNAFHPLAKIIKDISAGAVFISALNALVVGYIIFSKNLSIIRFDDGIIKIRQSSWHVTFIALITVLFFVVVGKVLSKKGTPFRGGMPSGHAAFAFSLWTIVSFFTKQGLVSALTFLMAVLIARHRVITKIHTVWEVVVGSVLGILTTALVFQVLR